MNDLIIITSDDVRKRGLGAPRAPRDTYRFLFTDDYDLVFTDIGDHCIALGRAGFPAAARDASEMDCAMLAATWGRKHVIAAGLLNLEDVSWRSEGLGLTTPEHLRPLVAPLLQIALLHLFRKAN